MTAQTADQLLDTCRVELADVAASPLWSDGELYGYMTEGVDIMSDDGGLQPAVVTLAYTANQVLVSLPAKVTQIRHVRHVERNASVAEVNVNDVSTGDLFGYTATAPVSYTRDYDAKGLRLLPAPTEAGTLELAVLVTSVLPMDAGVPLPFWRPRDQRLLLTYMKHRAYQNHDAEKEDLVRARAFGAEFYAALEAREAQNRRQRRAPGQIRMEW